MSTTHGFARTKLHNRWKAMRQRCKNPNAQNYKWYGGKGIQVDPEWDDYVIFRQWAIDNGWREDLELDRIDSNDDYKPSNCEFITHAENIRRSSSTILTEDEVLDIKNAYLLIPELKSREVSDAYGISQGHVRSIARGSAWSHL